MITMPSYASPTMVAKRIVQEFWTQSPVIKTANTDYAFLFESNKFTTPGTSFDVALDARFTLQRTDAVTLEGIVDRTVPVTVQNPYRMAAAYTTTAQKLLIRDLERQTIMPMASTIAAGIEQDLYAQFEMNVYNSFDCTTTYSNSASGLMDTQEKVLQVTTFFRNYSIPKKGNPWYMAARPNDLGALTTNFYSQFLVKTNESALKNDIDAVGTFQSFESYYSEILYTHDGGTAGGATGATVSATVGTGNTVTLTGLTAGLTFEVGDRITFVNSYKVNPVTRQDITSAPFQAVVGANATVAGGGTVTLTINVGPGGLNATTTDPNRNLNRPLTAGDSVKIFSQFAMNLFYTASAVLFAPITQEPFDVAPNQKGQYTDPHSKVSLRVTKYPSPGTNQNTVYVDALMAMGIAPEGSALVMTDA